MAGYEISVSIENDQFGTGHTIVSFSHEGIVELTTGFSPTDLSLLNNVRMSFGITVGGIVDDDPISSYEDELVTKNIQVSEHNMLRHSPPRKKM